MPLRLGLTALLTVLVIVLALRIIFRIRKDGTKVIVTDSRTDSPPIDIDTPPYDPDYVESGIKMHLKEIETLSEIMMKTTPSLDIRRKSHKILTASRNAENILANQALISPDRLMPNYKPINVNFHDLIKSAAQQWASQIDNTHVKFTCHIDREIPEHLFLDEAILGRILQSLLSNSRAMTKEGRIHLHVTATNPVNYDWNVNVIIADTGRGLSNTFKSDLQDNLNSIDPGNIEELNLVAVKKLLPLIKGSMTVNSVEKRGTEITISFPTRAGETYSQETEINAAKAKTDKDGPLSGKRILIIEDDVSSREVLQTFLVPEGCHTKCIPDGNLALQTLDAETFDLILMDVRMDGLDGIKTTKAIRNSGKNYSQIPIIAITADVDPDTNAKCMMAGADLFLNKPLGSKALFDGIRFVMDLGVDTKPTPIAKAS